MNRENIEECIDKLRDAVAQEGSTAALADAFMELGIALGLEEPLDPLAQEPQGRKLPETAPEFYRSRPDRSEKPAEFIQRVYGPWLGRGLIQADLLHLDKSLYSALHNWLRYNKMPEWLDLPSLKQANDRALAENGLEEGETLSYPALSRSLRKKLSLYNAARHRMRGGD